MSLLTRRIQCFPISTAMRVPFLSRRGNRPFRSFAPLSAPTTPNNLPFKFLRQMLILQKATDRQKGTSKLEKMAEPGSKTSVSDFLTILSQVILLAGTGFLAFTLAFPATVSDQLEMYKEKLTDRKHEKMLEFMASSRHYVLGDTKKGDALYFDNHIYHDDVASEIRDVIFQSPVLKYGIVCAKPGSGKSRLLRSLASEQPYFGFLSMGLISGVKSLVDALSEEIGFDFDAFSDRLVANYLGATSSNFPTQIDRLAYLLDEFEEACWRLKFDEKNASLPNPQRPLLVLDDIDSLDLDDPETRKAVILLFNAANKFAREDTARIVFSVTDVSFHMHLESLVRRGVLANAKVFHVGDLSEDAARRFLGDNLKKRSVDSESSSSLPPLESSAQSSGQWKWVWGQVNSNSNKTSDEDLILRRVGTRISDLLRVCEEVEKTGSSASAVIDRATDEAVGVIARAFDDMQMNRTARRRAPVTPVSPANTLTIVPQDRMRKLWKFIDDVVIEHTVYDVIGLAEPRDTDLISSHLLWSEARKAGVSDLLEQLLELQIIGFSGSFNSILLENAYKKYRALKRNLRLDVAFEK